MKSDLNQSFISLVKLGIGHDLDALFQNVNWVELKELAEKQGLSAVVLDGIEKLPEQYRPPKVFLLEWIGETLQGYEYRYELYCRTIAEMAGFYNSHGYKMMVLKGYACSLENLRIRGTGTFIHAYRGVNEGIKVCCNCFYLSRWAA